MYRVRIEHAGYDQAPFDFEYRCQAGDFIEALMNAKGIAEKVTITLQEIKDDDHE